jgi:hypothetical protein
MASRSSLLLPCSEECSFCKDKEKGALRTQSSLVPSQTVEVRGIPGSFVLMSRVHPLDLIPKYLQTQVFPEHASPLSIGARDGTLGLCLFVITPIVLITLLRMLLSLYFLFLIRLLLGFTPSSRMKGKGESKALG